MTEDLEKIAYRAGIFIDILFSIYFLGIAFLKDMNKIILGFGIGIVSHYIIKLIVFLIILYPSWGVKVTIPACEENTGDTICTTLNKQCNPNECGSYKEVTKYFNIESYKKYLTKSKSSDKKPLGSSKDYDIKRLISSELISFFTCVVYLLLLYFYYTGVGALELNLVRLLGLALIVATGVMFMFYEKDVKNIDNFQLISISIIIILSLICSTFDDSAMLYYLSPLLIIPFVIFPRFVIDSKDYCSYRTQDTCIKDENKDDGIDCQWDKNNRTCVDLGNVPDGRDNLECSEHTDENSCLNNDCYYVKLNVNQSDLDSEGQSKVDSKIGCISENHKCRGYSCTSEFYPFNIFNDCCNDQLYNNDCSESELTDHLNNEEEMLNEIKGDDSLIKTMYGQEAWSNKVDFDESYRYCESKNRRSEIDAGIYA